MVIGSGIIANSFLEIFKDRHDICIFASGVSSSVCESEHEFQREEKLLVGTQKELPNGCLLIYFSTCSVKRPSSEHTPYIIHKKRMEKVVKSYSPCLVIRLPQTAGLNGNPDNFLNFIIHSIKNNKEISIWQNVERNLLDVDDLPRIIEEITKQKEFKNKTVTVANPESYDVIEIVRLAEKVISKSATIKIEKQQGQDLRRSNEFLLDDSILKIISECNSELSEQIYIEKLIQKYLR